MGTFSFIIIGVLAGLGIAFLISQGLSEAGYAACIIFLLILLALGGEFLPIIRKVPDIEPSWDDEDAP
jgi:hypothetical protein